MLKLLISSGDLCHDKLGVYLYYLSFYFKCLGFKSIIDRYLFKIEKDDFKEKSIWIFINLSFYCYGFRNNWIKSRA